MNKKKIIIIGSGFSSLAASCYLARAGYNVKILEKNHEIGGRARQKREMDLSSTLAPLFIGCQMFLKVFLMILVKNQVIFIN